MNGSILIVDDEPQIIRSVLRVLNEGNYLTFDTSNPFEAINIIETHSIDLILSDNRMPLLTGLNLLMKVKKISPKTVRILMSGYSDLDSVNEAIINEDIYCYIIKPWNNNSLLNIIDEAIKFKRSIKEKEKEQLYLIENDTCNFINLKNDSDVKKLDIETYLELYKKSNVMMALGNINDNKIIDFNDAALSFLKYKRDEIKGKSSKELGLFPDFKNQEFKDILKLLGLNSMSRDINLRINDKDNNTHSVVFIIDEIKIRNIFYWVISFIDITKREENKKKLIQAKKDFENESLLKSVFMSQISHEIKTPTNSILGYTELLANTNLTKEQKHYIENIKISINTLLRTVNDILDINKLKAGKIILLNEIFNLDSYLMEIISQTQMKISDKNLQIFLSIDKDIPMYLEGDSIRLKQILVVLLDNAIKFTEGGTISVKAWLLENYTNNVLLQFSVSDTGPGISKEDQKKIFVPFSQGNINCNKKIIGNGLGLSICKEIVGLFNGDIWVESSLGNGSKFFFTAFFNKFSEAEKSLLNFQDEKISETELFKILKGKSVLVVEDNELNQELINIILNKADMVVTITSTAKEALKVVGEQKFNYILMDINLPDINGYEATKEIRKQEYYKNIPIIAISADSTLDISERFSVAGINDFISKPFNSEQLLKKMTKWI